MIRSIRGGTSVVCDDKPCAPGDRGVLTLSAVTSGQFQPAESKRALPEEQHRLTTPVRDGTVLITRKNTPELVGRVALVRGDYVDLFLPDLIWEIAANQDADARWLHAFLDGAAFRATIAAGAAGSSQSMVGITRELVLGAEGLIPPIEEQCRIGAVLETWDNAIAVAEQIAQVRRHRFAWMQDTVLCGRVRLPGFLRPWQAKPLSRVLREHHTTSTGAEPVFSVSVHRGLVDQVEHLGRSFAAASTAHYNVVRPGDIVYTKSPTGDFPLGIIKQSKIERDVIVSPLYGVFTPASRELGTLLDAYFANPDKAIRYLTPLVQKGAKNTIAVTNTQFLQGNVMLPSDDAETVALATLVETSLSDLHDADHEVALLRRQKRGLMQKLLTGEWRVPARGDAFTPGGPATDCLAEASE